jgi:ERO1-like protein alpha
MMPGEKPSTRQRRTKKSSTSTNARSRPSTTTTTSTTTTRISLWTALLWIAIVAAALGWLVSSLGMRKQQESVEPHARTTTTIEPGDNDSLRLIPERPLSNNDLASSVAVLDDDPCTCTTNNAISLAAAMGLNGTVADCCCSFADLERANLDIIYPLLRQTVATPFFAHFKMDLIADCPLWKDQPVCKLRDCSVCEVDEPPWWAAQVDWMPKMIAGETAANDGDCDDDNEDYFNTEDRIVTTVDKYVRNDWSAAPTSFFDTSTDPPDDDVMASFMTPATTTDSASASSSAVVVDLRLNPERYTGYDGASAAKVWSAVHLDNCFQQQEQPHSSSDQDYHDESAYCSLPSERRIYNRVISGMHSSISLHIAHSYCLVMDPQQSGECRTWGLSQDIGQSRVLRHRDRLENLYVAFALLLRAVQKAGPAIAAAVPQQDDFYADSLSEWTDHLWPELSRLAQSCPQAFDETSLLTSAHARPQLLSRFRHLQQIMQCVGCDRCKLWGTLQTLGIGTALRILLPSPSTASVVKNDDDDASLLTLSRQEAVALVHTLERFSSALVFADELRRLPK